jgi:threonine dehydrogenase-like Zn-dependent dehydrogenase
VGLLLGVYAYYPSTFLVVMMVEVLGYFVLLFWAWNRSGSGTAGIKSFEQAQRMLKSDGTIHLIAKYQAGDGVPRSGLLPLDSGIMQRKQIIFSYWKSPSGATLQDVDDTVEMMLDGKMQIDPLITHRMPWEETPEAYHMLYKEPAAALGVIMEWDR